MTHRAGVRSAKSDDADKTAFRRLVPDDERVMTRPMFGSVAAFANGYMFMGLFGPDLFVRLPPSDREARTAAGWHSLEVMPGKAMGDYLVHPGDWRTDTDTVREQALRALDYVTSLPPKK